MPKPNQLTTLRVEDFGSEQRAWIPRLLLPLNQFLTSTYNILNGRVEFGPNVPCLAQTLTFTYGNASQSFMWTQTTRPRILWVGEATEDGTPVGLQASWLYNASTQKLFVDFYKLNGAALTVGSAYSVFIRVVP